MNSSCMRRFRKLLLVASVLVCVLTTAIFAEGDAGVVNAVHGTIVSLLLSIVAIGLVLIIKEVYSSLFLDILIGCFLQADGNPVDAFQLFVSHLCFDAGGNMGILTFLIILSTAVALMIRAGGSKAYGDWAMSHIETKSGAPWSTFVLAIVLDVDGYFNNLTTDNAVRPVADGHYISHAKLSYIYDTTAAPVCIMMPVSSWATAVTGVIGNEEVNLQIFLRVIPFNYYATLALVFIIVMTCLDIDYGPTRTRELNAAKGDLYTTPEHPLENAAKMEFNPGDKVIDLVIPVIILVIDCVSSMIYVGLQDGGHNLITAFANASVPDALPLSSLIALTISMVYFMVRRSMKFTELMDCLPEGFKQTVPAILILCLAWTTGGVTKGLGASEPVVGIMKNLNDSLYALLPAVVFIIATFLGFTTGISWGTSSILLPIVISVFSGGAPAMDLTMDDLNNNLLVISITTTLGGVAIGNHRLPIPDTTIVVSSDTQCCHLNHVAVRLPYTVTVAVVAFVDYIITVFIQVPFIYLPIVIVSMVLVMLVIGEINHSTNRHSQHD